MSRRAAVAKVQIARKEVGLDDVTYRAMLERITGRTSSADCTDQQLGLVLDEMKAKGWKPKVVSGGRTARRPRAVADHPSAKKARALWLSLWNLGEIRDPSEAALEAFARRQLGVAQLQWADQGQCYKLIEALKGMAERVGWSQKTDRPDLGEPIFQLKFALANAQRERLWKKHQEISEATATIQWDEASLDRQIAAMGRIIRNLEAAG